MWDARRNLIFREVHPVISEKEIIAQVPPREEMEYKPHSRQIQNVVSICYFL
jgi:hypothetical protein